MVELQWSGSGFTGMRIMCAGALAVPVQANTSISTAYTPRISIQPFATPGQRSFVGSYGSLPKLTGTSWGGRQ